LSSIVSPAGTFSYSYNVYNGLLSGMICTSGVSATYTYDVLDRPTGLEWRNISNAVVRSFSYGYNAAGLATNMTRENGESAAFSYYDLDRLTSEQWYNTTGGVVHSASYQYDLVGNRTQAVINGQSINYTLSANRLTSWGTNGSQQFDAAGNVTNLQDDSGRQLSVTWDSRYSLTAVYTNGTLAESYGYDALGRRISISDGSAATYLIYDGSHVIAETASDGSLTRSYVYSPAVDDILAMKVYGVTTQTYYYVKDRVGTVNALVDESGVTKESYRYDAWGNVLGVYDSTGGVMQTSAVGNRYLWQGREYSFKTKLNYFRARYYDSETGRWLSNDPIGIAGGLDQYVFCSDNPVMFRDPYGLVKWKQAARATLGIIGNSAGIAVGIGVGLLPEPTMITKVAGVAIMLKSGYGYGANIRNLSDAILDRNSSSRGSLATDVAELTSPGNQQAQRLANIVDLTTDLLTGIQARNAAINSLGQLDRFGLERVYVTDPTDLGRAVESLQAADVGWTIWEAGEDVLGNLHDNDTCK